MKKAVYGLILTLLLTNMLVLSSNIQQVKAEPKTWTVDDDGPADFSSIQEAINAASPGDTIYVKNGTYYENVEVNKTVSLIGENRDTTIIDGGGNQNVVFVTADNVTIIDFTIRNSGTINPGGYGGIGVSGADHVTVENNNLVNNDVGIWIYDSNCDSFANNNISYNAKSGVYTKYANGTVIADNIVANNPWGIVLRNGTNSSIVVDNSVYSSDYTGIQVGPESELNTIICNTVTYNDYGITVFSPGNNVFSDNNVSSSKYDGIVLQETTNNTVTRNILTRNKEFGITVYYADGNTFNYNMIMHNGSPAVSAGIYLESSYNNVFYHNELIANTQSQVYSSNSINSWNTSYPSGGNYWSDYTDVDDKNGQNQDQPGSDGIWDHPYFIDGDNLDNYPLVSPWGNWQHYHDYSEIVNTLFYLNDQYPNIVELFSIGKSYEGKDIYCLKLTNETNTHPKPKVLFVGYHHAREPISAELPLYFAVKAATSFGSDPAITRMLNYSEVYIVAALNIDGFEAVKKNEWQRKNVHPTDEDSDSMFDEDPPEDTNGDGYIAALVRGTPPWEGTIIGWEGADNDTDGLSNEDWVGGVDINRNYGYQWNATCFSGSPDPSAEAYRGPAPFSEPETQAIRDLALSHDFKYAISFHSGTEAIGYPWGYTTDPTPDDSILREVASNLSTLVSAPYGQNSGLYNMSGSWDDWMYANRSTFALTCEIYTNNSAWQYEPGPEPDTWWMKGILQAFNPDPSQIEPVIQRWLPAFTYTTDRAITEAYNVAATAVASPKTVVDQGYCVNVTVTAVNEGEFTEAVNLTLHTNTTTLASQIITLASGDSATINFTWNTTGFAKGNYTLSAYAWPIPGETDTADNNFTDGWIIVSIVGDITGAPGVPWPGLPDRHVDGKDLTLIAYCFGTWPAVPPPKVWVPNADINNDGKVDGKDLTALAIHFGQYDP